VARRGSAALLIPPPAPSSPFKFSWQLPETASCTLHYGPAAVDTRDLEGILVRALPELPTDSCYDSNDHYLRVEWHAAMVGWLQSVPATVIDRPRPRAMLSLPILPALGGVFSACGLPLATVMVTDSASEGAAFVRECGSLAHQVTGLCGDPVPVAADALQEGICSLVAIPPGVRRRVHLAGGEAFAEMVTGDGADGAGWASDCALPADLAQACRSLAAGLGLRFAELDIVTGEGGHQVIGAAEVSEATFGDPLHRARVAAALAEELVGPRREAPL
jgi:hypothetical protein